VELASTFEKMIQQLDIISKTMKIMDQRIGTVENQVSDIYDLHKEKKRDYYKSLPKTYPSNENMNMNYKNTSHSNSIRSNRQQEVYMPNDIIDNNNLNNYGEQNYYMNNNNNNNENKQMYNEYSNSNMISASKVNFKEK